MIFMKSHALGCHYTLIFWGCDKLHDARTDRIDIKLEIDVVRGQRTAYETKLHE
ncbi:hypothetical protein Tco_1037996, partial [Tanacetum coccineum]